MEARAHSDIWCVHHLLLDAKLVALPFAFPFVAHLSCHKHANMLLVFHNGTSVPFLVSRFLPEHTVNAPTRTLSLNSKLSTTIVLELMDAAGGEPWRKWKSEATSKNLPIVPGEESISDLVKGRVEAQAIKDLEMEKKSSTPTPGLDAFRASRGGKGSSGSKTSIPPPVTVTDENRVSASS